MDVAKIVLELFELRRRLEVDRRTATININRQRLAGTDADDALHVGEALDLLAVDCGNQISGLESGSLGRAGRLHRVDPRARRLLADRHENGGKNRYRKHEIRNRPG